MQGITIDKLPPKGLMLAYFREKLLFSPYEVTGGELEFYGQDLFAKDEPYECHFFDDKTEYRMIKRIARKDVIERVLTREEEDGMLPELIFSEEVMVKTEYTKIQGIPEKMRIINRYQYSENDVLTLKDYRIAIFEA
jgi:hypothetical protein